MRIAYGVHGYGRGHATRAAAVLSELARRHEVLILAGGDAYDTLCREHTVTRIPTLGYRYRANGTRSNLLTFKSNYRSVMDIWRRGPVSGLVEEILRDHQTEIVISDAEPWTHRSAERLGIPRIGFDHFGIMAYCRPELTLADRLVAARDVWLYRRLMGQPERVLVSSFFPAPPRRPGVRVVPPLLRREVYSPEAARGEHLLVYFNKGEHLFSKRIENALRALERPVVVYGAGRVGPCGNIRFRAPANVSFLEDLASCRAVFSTAGNQLVGEALHFRKPMLVMPEDCPEQRMNARALEALGIGRAVPHGRVDARDLQEFLAHEDQFVRALSARAADGRREAAEALEQFIAELAVPSADRRESRVA